MKKKRIKPAQVVLFAVILTLIAANVYAAWYYRDRDAWLRANRITEVAK